MTSTDLHDCHSPGDHRRTRSERTAALLAEAGQPETSAARRHDLLDQVVELNMPVAASVARRYAHRGIALEDLTQVAYLALVRAVSSFDHTLGHDLLTFAVPNIQGELRRHFRDHGWAVRPPREIQRVHSAILRSGTSRERWDSVSLESLARDVDADVVLVREALVAKQDYTTLSLDKPVEDGGTTTLDVDDPAVEHEQLAAEARAMLEPLVQAMDEREQLILRWRFADELSQRQIAERLGMTQVQVSRLLQRMLTQMRSSLGDAD